MKSSEDENKTKLKWRFDLRFRFKFIYISDFKVSLQQTTNLSVKKYIFQFNRNE